MGQEAEENPLILKIREYLINAYDPVANPPEATITLTTTEIYTKLQQLYPSLEYSPSDVATWLDHAGFIFVDKGTLKMEWLLKKNKDFKHVTPKISI